MALTFSVNNTFPTNSGNNIWFLIKETLITAGWIAKESGNGVSTYSASSDILTNSAIMGTNNAWIRLQAQCLDGYNREIIMQRGGTGTQYNIYYSHADNFIGGSPSATARSTATDEVYIWQNMPGSGIGERWTNTSSAMRFHMYAGDANSDFIFGAFCYNTAGTVIHTGLFFDICESGTYSSLDQDPYVWMYQSKPGFGETITPFTKEGMAFNCQGWLGVNLPGEGFKGIPAIVLADYINFTLSSNIMKQIGTNIFNNNDDLFPVICIRSPETIVQQYVPPFGYKGMLKNIKFLASTTRALGDTLTINSASDNIVIGDIIVPWDGSLPAV